MSRCFPRLLVATEFPPNASGGGPAVVRQMLAGWPVDRLHWWSCLPEVDRRFGQQVATHGIAKIPARLYPQHRWTNAKAAILAHFWAHWAAAHLRGAIVRVRPDAIWAIPHNWSALPLAHALPRSGHGWHVSIHDFVDAHGMAERIGPRRCEALLRAVDRVYSGARSRDVIAHPMIEEMARRTGQSEASLNRAGAEPEDFAFLEAKQPHASSVIRIAYAGSIIAEREFVLFVQAVDSLRDRVSQPIELHLFGAHRFPTQQWFNPRWMHDRGNLPQADLLDALRTCHWGFSPMDLADTNPRYNRFSFPTKFIIYLAAGLPVFTLGHRESTVVQMAERYRVGVCAQTPEAGELARILEASLSDVNPWSSFRDEILRCARAEFDAAKMRSTLRRCFAECAGRAQSI